MIPTFQFAKRSTALTFHKVSCEGDEMDDDEEQEGEDDEECFRFVCDNKSWNLSNELGTYFQAMIMVVNFVACGIVNGRTRRAARIAFRVTVKNR
uniref:Uncharacterized protein n=1 Tax=Romanomermis culicivorax TaxID=13658 RepID=A0A915IER8_ROMCU